jgi:hypothetical protein
MRYLRLVAALGTLFAPYWVCAAGNSFVRGDHIAFLVTEFTRVAGSRTAARAPTASRGTTAQKGSPARRGPRGRSG